MLGVIIGVATVIALTEIGEASKKAIRNGHCQHGCGYSYHPTGSGGQRRRQAWYRHVPTLETADADEMLQQCPAVRAVTLIVRANAQVVYGNRNWIPGDITGTTPAYLAVSTGETWTRARFSRTAT